MQQLALTIAKHLDGESVGDGMMVLAALASSILIRSTPNKDTALKAADFLAEATKDGINQNWDKHRAIKHQSETAGVA
ncbi:hypothetical protein GMO_11750 [Gluconobacter morbifer G707]|uniref:Uncharacterized protein n=1 Tax=Gluconobacter morbifer G707 TaxID=1088869 RepID=G6XIX5_9PROT|nr:hypothetical protein GMO_11750 [Gluconobacter morbifer G707]